MTDRYELQLNPVFEDGIFERHPELFERFTRRVSESLRQQFSQARAALTASLGRLTWPLLTGPGLNAGTHPGADNVFVETMLGFNPFIYNSDCLYAFPARRIFAVSDPPGITETSRRIFERLDRRLREDGTASLAEILNDLNRRLPVNDGATLTLISLDGNGRAQAFIAGDTFLFHGSSPSGTLREIRGGREFFGTPYTTLQPIELEVAPGDYFIIASDGILSLRGSQRHRPITEVLLEHAGQGLDDLALRALQQSNLRLEETIYGQRLTRFGGNDNVTMVVVQPDKLADGSGDSHILGGSIQRRPVSSA